LDGSCGEGAGLMLSQRVCLLRDALKPLGFDICAPFPLKSYNTHCKDNHKVSAFDRNDNHSVLIGCSRLFWSPFSEWVRSLPEVPAHPIDAYTSHVISTTAERVICKDWKYEIRYDYYVPATGLFVHLQTAAHCSGTGYFDHETMWSIHPTFGLWHMLKAVLIFDADFEGSSPPLLLNPLSPLVKEEMKRLTAVATSESWKNIVTRLAIRDACDFGKEWRYEQDMLDYFYPITRLSSQVIVDIRKSVHTEK